jgi:benzoyl-CoA reductase subunit C
MNDTFARYTADRHSAVKNWKKETGKKVYGYFCCLTPEEILSAADVLPVRITGTGEPLQMADEYIPPNTCPFARSCLDAGLRGQYDYLDAVIAPNSCDLVAQMHYFWKTLVPRPDKPALIAGLDLKPYVHYIAYPEKITGRSVLAYYLEVLTLFKQELERSLRRAITDEDFARAITAYNKDKAQMKRMYEMRKSNPPALSGYEAWQITFASTQMPKADHAALLKDYLDEMEKSKRSAKEGVRIYLSGSAMDQAGSGLYKIIEESGGQVVSDDLCVGTRSFWYPLDASLPPLEAIARRSLGTACPRSTVVAPIPENRWGHITATIKDVDAKGVIFYVLKCCDARLGEFPHLRDKIRGELGLPVLFLEGDYTAEGLEQMRGRIEAFVEMIEG